MKGIILKYFISVWLIFSLSGCLDNRVAPELNFQTESAIELLVHLESHGDYINSDGLNEFVTASEVYSIRNSYLIIDVRPSNDFVAGHIEHAVNVEPKNLLDYLKSLDLNLYPKIVIVSESGQSAAYYAALLNFAGFSKVYSMEYGMAAWNHDFASIWLNAVRDFRTGAEGQNHFTNENYPKPAITNLPKLSFQDSKKSIKKKLEERVTTLLAIGFDEKLDNTDVAPKRAQSMFDDGMASITASIVYSSYSFETNSFTDYFVICFGSNFLYRAHSLEGPFAGQGHLPSAVQYLPNMDLRSTNDLQTIPANQTAVIYDVNGQVSAKVAAYLRVLGYDAKSILFGANTLFYSRVNWVESLRPFAFKQEMIMNFPYVTGN